MLTKKKTRGCGQKAWVNCQIACWIMKACPQKQIPGKPLQACCQNLDNGNCLSYFGKWCRKYKCLITTSFKFHSSQIDSFLLNLSWQQALARLSHWNLTYSSSLVFPAMPYISKHTSISRFVFWTDRSDKGKGHKKPPNDMFIRKTVTQYF